MHCPEFDTFLGHSFMKLSHEDYSHSLLLIEKAVVVY